MYFGKSYWKTQEQGIQKEWLLANGIGGFSSGTIIGMNARRYHGLLVASLTPPVERHLILSQISERVVLDGEEYYLHSFRTHDFAGHGEYHLEAFHLNNGLPEFHYRIGSTTIKKRICLRYGMNQVVIVYNISNPGKKGIIQLMPLVNFRNYHYLSFHQYMTFTADADGRKIEITPYDMDTKISIDCSEGKVFIKNQCFFHNMDYYYEHERGLNGTEDHFIPGFYEIGLDAGDEKTITVVCSIVDPITSLDGESFINDEIKRQKALLNGFPEDQFLRMLVSAADKFIVYRRSTNSKSVIAGYPWFTDWGRDTMIALPGLTLTTGRYDDARNILRTFASYEKDGLLPNVFPDGTGDPAYNTVDASLWFFEAVYKYYLYTNDIDFIDNHLLKTMLNIINSYKNGTLFNIRMEKDCLISAGNSETQLTWMDAKAGNWVVTPRHGKAVEINALWYNALMVMAEIMRLTERNGDEFSALAAKVKKAFIEQFWNEHGNCLFDVVGDHEKDDKMRPNQIIAVSLSFPVLDGTMARCVVDSVHEHLYTSMGLLSLSRSDPQYRGIYAGDQFARDGAYHQGTVWTWLLGRFITAYARVYKDKDNIKKQLESFYLPFHDHLRDACIGSISEIFDGNEPLIPRGCFAQAWSVAEILRSYVEDYMPLLN
ncbi:MAG: glycogen debranching protein [Clostridiaceae bacterium]|nr:glycogen debranching protein [Clostridiaceae bacterium]